MLSRFRFSTPAFLGILHALSDCAAGWMIASLPESGGSLRITAILVYNALAFAAQVPAGMLTDKVGRPQVFLGSSLFLMGASLLLFSVSPLAAVLMAGVSSCFFHVSGGMMSLLSAPGEAKGPAWFAAPGVTGLVLGGWMGSLQVPLHMLLAPMIFPLGAFAFRMTEPERRNQTEKPKSSSHLPEAHDLWMVMILFAIAFRSAMWDVVQSVYRGEWEFLIALAASATIGKIWGGYAADRWGWSRYATVALTLSAALLSFTPEGSYLSCAGVFFLQSATPSALAALHRTLPHLPATAAGLGLGLSIAAGGMLMFSGVHIPLSAGWMLLIPAAILSAVALRRAGKYPI